MPLMQDGLYVERQMLQTCIILHCAYTRNFSSFIHSHNFHHFHFLDCSFLILQSAFTLKSFPVYFVFLFTAMFFLSVVCWFVLSGYMVTDVSCVYYCTGLSAVFDWICALQVFMIIMILLFVDQGSDCGLGCSPWTGHSVHVLQ